MKPMTPMEKENKKLKRDVEFLTKRTSELEAMLLTVAPARAHYAATCSRCGNKLESGAPFIKLSCPSCKREGIDIQLNSQLQLR